ncbi:cytidine deaminase [Euzebya tangerina]|uniref:cytidine deaminase n=1 Tax=Euzebya tangerina TaxID=591198 RepID=UPI000E31E6F8|nr:cytidine deaminase [Euzebya tangerina]
MSPSPEELDELLEQAVAARERAYAPYSDFRVGAALRTTDGTVFRGCNVENAAYPATICAERTALVGAVAAGHHHFDAIAVVGSGPGATTPCGVCRQMLFEFAPDLVVHAAGTDGATMTVRLGEALLPHGFGPARLRAAGGGTAP